jgi:hypothetical protein
MFQGVELIFSILSVETSELEDVACDVLSRRMTLGTINLPSERLKKQHW